MTAAVSPRSLPQSSTGRFDVSRVDAVGAVIQRAPRAPLPIGPPSGVPPA